MAWTEITRRHYRRDGLRYESDSAEWFVMEPLLPPASALGRPRATDMRTVINAIFYIASTGCQWRQLPKDFPPYSTVQGYFYAWSRGGIFVSLNYTLVMASREAAGREASPTADVGPIIGPSITAFRVKQHAVPSVSDPAGSREYLVDIGAAVERRSRADRRPTDARPIKIPFNAKYPAASRRLPIIAYDAASGGTGSIEATS